ncbi:MAG: ferrochelatase, partial [Pirellulales bacterium]|nr:ferrochelatase [Pirellulales bacterium]
MYDAVLLVSFGGPEGPDDVLPFLENVLLGRNVPRARMLEVAEHYHHFGGVSPINAQNRALIAALRQELAAYGPNLPIYWGNRNWHPLLPDTLAQMRADGIQRAIAFFTSAYSSYSGCRQYRENILAAANAIGPGAPQVDKLRVFYNHPGFIEPMLEQTQTALAQLSSEQQASAAVLFTAHSIPVAMAQNTRYQAQLQETCRLIAEELRKCTDSHHGKQWRGPWQLVYQSRSGPPTQPWLEPDIGDALRQVHAEGIPAAVVVPVGFISDHMEVL